MSDGEDEAPELAKDARYPLKLTYCGGALLLLILIILVLVGVVNALQSLANVSATRFEPSPSLPCPRPLSLTL